MILNFYKKQYIENYDRAIKRNFASINLQWYSFQKIRFGNIISWVKKMVLCMSETFQKLYSYNFIRFFIHGKEKIEDI